MDQILTRPASLRESLQSALEVPLVRLRLGYAAWLFGVFCYFLPAATWNPVSRFDLTRSIVERGTFQIDAYVDNTGDRARRGEHWYSDKAPLAAFLALPAYEAYHLLERWRGREPTYRVYATPDRPAQRVVVNRSFQRALYVCSISTAAVAGVGLGLALFELLRRRIPVRAALAGSALTVLGTPIFPYATSFYGHAIAGGLLLCGLSLLDGSTGPDVDARNFRWRVAAGACLAASAGCEYLSAVPVAALLITFSAFLLVSGSGTSHDHPRTRLMALALPLALGAVVPVLLVAAYQWRCFGAPWRTGYSFIVDPTFAAGHATGFLGVRTPHGAALWGLCFGRLRGLFYISPVALPLACGLVVGARRGDRTAFAAALGFLALLLVNASYYMWWGGAAAGPRHLVPVLGLLALGLPWLWERPWRRAVTALLGAVSITNMLAIAAVGLEAPEHGDVLIDFAYGRLLQGKLSELSGASNLGIEVGLVRGGTLGPLLAWLIVGAYVLHHLVRELGSEPQATR
jgi:hypothetical protein